MLRVLIEVNSVIEGGFAAVEAEYVLELADTAYLLETGRIVLSGPASAVRSHDAVRTAEKAMAFLKPFAAQ